jgi:hypothetical protein
MAVKTWVWVVVGLVSVMTVGCFALVGTGVYVVSRNMNIQQTSEASATERFERTLAALPNKTPLLVFDGPTVRRSEQPAAEVEIAKPTAPPAAPVTALHFMVWDPEDRHIVEFRVPFWLFRLSGSVDVGSDHGFDFEQLKLSPEEVARRGPGLILDHKTRDGERVMMWAQ